MCPTALILILCAKKKRPQPGEDGYGRLVRVQQGRGGDDSSHALEPADNARRPEEFRAYLLARPARHQGSLCKVIAAPKFYSRDLLP